MLVPGKKYIVRSWESMEKEFGLTRSGSISCQYRFTNDMKMYCGKIVTYAGNNTMTYNGKRTEFMWSEDMVKPLENCISILLINGTLIK